jgi:PAS domain S-box-containing protein
MCVVWDTNFCVTFWSERAQKLFRLQEEDVMGRKAWEWMGLSARDQRKASRVIKRLTKREIDRHILRLEHQLQDGTSMQCDWYLYGVSHDGDKPSAIEAIIRYVPAS